MAETRAWEQRYAELEAMVADACVPSKARRSGSDHFARSGEDRRFGGDDRRFGGQFQDRKFGRDDRRTEEGYLRGGGRQTYGSFNRLTKIEFPRFNGENVRGWVFKAEEFFGVDFTPPDLKVKMAAIHFDDFASEWHQNFIKSDVGMSVLYDWESYVHFLREMFEDEDEDPLAELKKLKETDGIRQYHQQFEDIRTRLRLPEHYLVSVYLAGLRLETRRHIKMFQPQTVRHCFSLGKTYEKAHPKPPMTANWSPKSVNSMGYSRDQMEKTVDVTVKTNLQPTKRLSQQERNDRRSKNLCYLCEEKYTPEHYLVHKKTQLYCMDVVEDELEDAEEGLCEVEEVVNNTSEPMPRISVNAISGISDYETMRAEEPPKTVVDEVPVQPIELVVRDQAQEASSDVVSLPGAQENRVQHEKESRLEVVTDKKEPMEVDTSEVEHKTESFPFLKFVTGQHLLWMQNKSEPILIILEVEGKKKLCYKTWMFKYKADEEDQGILQLRNGWVQEVSAVICFRRWRHLHLHLDCEEPELAGRKRNHGLFIRVHNKLKQQRCPKSWMFKYKGVKESIQRLQILLRYKNMSELKGSVSAERESESNQPTLRFSTWDIEILLNHYMVLLLTLVAYAIQFLGGVGMDKKQSPLSLWINRVWDPGRSLVKDASYSTRVFPSLPATVPVSLLCQEAFAYQITSFSTNLEVKVSLKGEDLLQVIWVMGHIGLTVWDYCVNGPREDMKLMRIKGRRRSDWKTSSNNCVIEV